MSDDRVGCCKCCGIEVHIAMDGYLVTVILADESMMDVSICAKCLKGDWIGEGKLLDIIWAWECKAWMTQSDLSHNNWITGQLSDNFILDIMYREPEVRYIENG